MGNLSKQLAVYLTPSEKMELERFAILHKKKLSKLCRDIITNWMKEQIQKIGDMDGIFKPLEDAIKKNDVYVITADETSSNIKKFVLESEEK